MSTSPPASLLHPDSLLTMLNLAAITPDGCFVEVGVYRGGAAWYLLRLAKEMDRRLHLFDTFTGIPDRGPQDHEHRIGDFSDTSFEAVQRALGDYPIYHVGVFPSTMIRGWDEPIAFAHIDCDQYSGIKASIERILPLMPRGGIMLFDDYNATSGCRLAVKEAFGPSVLVTKQGKAYFVKV
jgi:Macrocin-O-methyltransferase (TylF)